MSAIPDLWYLTPIGVAAAVLATTVGIGGPVFLTPLFVLVLELPPATAVATALFTQLFGFLSGSVAYWRRGLIDFDIARGLLVTAIPAAILGSLIAPHVPGPLLRRVFGVIALVIAYRVFARMEGVRQTERPAGRENASRTLVDRSGTMYRYSPERPREGAMLAAGGGLLAGMTSVGLAETQGYHLILKRAIPPRIAVATTVFVVMVTVAAASAGHLATLAMDRRPGQLARVLMILAFTVPGVLVGGQLGPLAQARLAPTTIAAIIGVVLVGVGMTMIAV